MKGKRGEDTGRDGGTEVDSKDVFSYCASSTLLKQFTSIIKYFDLCSSYTKCHEELFSKYQVHTLFSSCLILIHVI